MEFAATGKPMVVFDERSDRPGDLVHDVHAVLPAAVAHDFETFAGALEQMFDPADDDPAGVPPAAVRRAPRRPERSRLVGTVKRLYLEG